MLNTPALFVPSLVADAHPNPITLLFRGDELLVRDADLQPADESVCGAAGAAAQYHPVGMWGERNFRTAWVGADAVPAAAHSFRKLRSLFGAMDERLLAIAGRAYQIAEWARTHRYCGACGSATELVVGERCVACPHCGMLAYPRISPAMMVLVRNGDAMLLARNVASPAGRFGALAGFLEAGESVEEAVHREVQEEVGLKIQNLHYFGSQSWPFPHSLMIAYTADYLSGEIRIDRNELAEADWYGPDDVLPDYAPEISIAGVLINAHIATHFGRADS